MDELKKTKTRAASSNYGQYFSENMWAIREMPFTLRATSGGYLTASGRGGKVDVDGRSHSHMRIKIVRCNTMLLKI